MNRSTLQVLGCYILWGLLPVFWKLLAGVNAAYVLAQRIVFSCLFCYAFIWIKKDGPAVRAILRDKKQRRLYLCCGLLISANWGVYILTVATGRILEASLAYYMNPLFSILIGALIFRERLTAVQWVSSALAFIGVMYSVVLYGNVPYLAIIIALSFALYGALKKGIRARSEVSICMETLSVLPLALGFILYAQFSGLTTFSSLTGSEIVFFGPQRGGDLRSHDAFCQRHPADQHHRRRHPHVCKSHAPALTGCVCLRGSLYQSQRRYLRLCLDCRDPLRGRHASPPQARLNRKN